MSPDIVTHLEGNGILLEPAIQEYIVCLLPGTMIEKYFSGSPGFTSPSKVSVKLPLNTVNLRLSFAP